MGVPIFSDTIPMMYVAAPKLKYNFYLQIDSYLLLQLLSKQVMLT